MGYSRELWSTIEDTDIQGTYEKAREQCYRRECAPSRVLSLLNYLYVFTTRFNEARGIEGPAATDLRGLCYDRDMARAAWERMKQRGWSKQSERRVRGLLARALAYTGHEDLGLVIQPRMTADVYDGTPRDYMHRCLPVAVRALGPQDFTYRLHLYLGARLVHGSAVNVTEGTLRGALALVEPVRRDDILLQEFDNIDSCVDRLAELAPAEWMRRLTKVVGTTSREYVNRRIRWLRLLLVCAFRCPLQTVQEDQAFMCAVSEARQITRSRLSPPLNPAVDSPRSRMGAQIATVTCEQEEEIQVRSEDNETFAMDDTTTQTTMGVQLETVASEQDGEMQPQSEDNETFATDDAKKRSTCARSVLFDHQTSCTDKGTDDGQSDSEESGGNDASRFRRHLLRVGTLLPRENELAQTPFWRCWRCNPTDAGPPCLRCGATNNNKRKRDVDAE